VSPDLPPRALETPIPDAPVFLFEEQVVLELGAVRAEGTGKLEVAWGPYPRVLATITFDQLPRGWANDLMAPGVTPLLRLSARAMSIPLIITGTRMGSDRPVVTGVVAGEIVRDTPPATVVVSYLPNLGDFITYSGPPAGPRRWSSQTELSDGEWTIRIKAARNANELTKALDRDGGFGITHKATVSRRDGSSFTYLDVQRVLEALGDFLSFARGARTAPILAAGYDEEGREVWQDLRLPTIGRWRLQHNWWDRERGEILSGVYPGFWNLWCDPAWYHPLRSTVYWYTNSNVGAGGLDGSLILGQAALESLSWMYLVREGRVLSERAFRRLRASDQIRRLLYTLEIPSAIPMDLTDLSAAASEFRWHDGPQAVTEMRNALVHPKLQTRLRFNKALPDIWNLAQWYIELAILRLSGFSGVHAYRLGTPGDVRPVPWQTP
jgi:hypothetical protein